MGYAAAGACFPSQADALASWCAHVEPGSTGSSCASCDPASSSCTLNVVPSGSSSAVQVVVPVASPACDVPTPAADAAAWSGAAVVLWVAVWAASQAVKLFWGGHANVE